MVRISELHSFHFCLLAVSPALFSLLEVRMDPHAASDVSVDAGTKKKSSFQITSVRKGDTASLSSEVGAIDEFDVDPDEGEGDGDEDDDNLSVSLSLDPSGDPANTLGSAGQTAPDVPQSQSKYRVVRIKKSGQGRTYSRGRWSCSDCDGNGDPAASPADVQAQDDEQSRKSIPRKASENPEEPSSEPNANHEELVRNGNANGGEPIVSAAQSTTTVSSKKVVFKAVATATIAPTTAAEDFSTSQATSNQPVAGAMFMAAVQEAAQKFCATEHNEMQALKSELSIATQQLKDLKVKFKGQSGEVDRLTEANRSLAEERRCASELLQRYDLHEG